MTDIVQHQNSTDMGAFDPNDEALVKYLGLNPNDPKSRAMVAVCRRYDLDPVLKHVVVIPGGGVYVTRDGLLHIAHRSGKLDGIVVEQDPSLVDGEWRAKVSVYRKDMRFPFTFPGRYPKDGGNRKYAQEMALKVAESHAYRRAFDINGLPSYDEHVADEAGASEGSNAPAPQFTKPAPEPGDQEPQQAEPETDEEQPAQTETLPVDEPDARYWRKRLFATLNDRGITDADEQRQGIGHIIGRTIESRSELSEDDAETVVKHLEATGGEQ